MYILSSWYRGDELFKRAGVWFVMQVVMTNICVFVAHEVTRNFASFNASLAMDKPHGVFLQVAKYDIENFFPNIPRELVRRGWAWLVSRNSAD